MEENRKKALAAALSQIEKQFGKGSVMRLGDAGATATCACHPGEEGRASPCAASNVAVRVDVAKFQFGALRHRRRALGLYSSRYLATTG